MNRIPDALITLAFMLIFYAAGVHSVYSSCNAVGKFWIGPIVYECQAIKPQAVTPKKQKTQI